jgi:ketosteroid isomerase-like protein
VSSENVEIVRAVYEATRRERTLDAFLELFDPGIVWDNRAVWPDGARYEGLEAVKNEGRRWFGTWEEYRFTAEEFIDEGDFVLVPLRVKARGRGSGVEVEHYFVEVWKLRDGKAVEHYAFPSKEEALAAIAQKREANGSV